MAQKIMFAAKSESLRAFLHGRRSFHIFGITLTIEHAHSNQYQVLLPDRSEIFRLIDHGHGDVRLLVV